LSDLAGDVVRERMDPAFPYFYAWKGDEKRATLSRRRFRIVKRMRMNSALVEFENGDREVISRNAIRKVKS